MELLKNVLATYSTALEFLPENFRLLAAIFILVILVVLFLRFIQKSIAWMVLFFLLLPAGWPALREIALSFWDKIIVPFMR